MYTRSTGPRHGARPERRRRTASALGIAGIAGMVIVACTSPDARISDMSTAARSASDQTSKAPMTVTAAELAGRRAVDSYKAMWLNMATAAETADWQSPLLSEYATGAALTTMSRGLYANHTEGRVSRGRPTLSPGVASVEPPDDPTRVWISDCGDSTNWLYYDAATGALVDDVPGGRRAISAVVDKQADGTWAVSDFAVQELGTC